MLSLLASVSRRQGNKGLELAARAYGSVVAAESGNPFTRFSNPYPAAIDHSPLLATLPETKVSTLKHGTLLDSASSCTLQSQVKRYDCMQDPCTAQRTQGALCKEPRLQKCINASTHQLQVASCVRFAGYHAEEWFECCY